MEIQKIQSLNLRLDPTQPETKVMSLQERANRVMGIGTGTGMGTDEVTEILVNAQEKSTNLSVLSSFVKKGLNVVTELTK